MLINKNCIWPRDRQWFNMTSVKNLYIHLKSFFQSAALDSQGNIVCNSFCPWEVRKSTGRHLRNPTEIAWTVLWNPLLGCWNTLNTQFLLSEDILPQVLFLTGFMVRVQPRERTGSKGWPQSQQVWALCNDSHIPQHPVKEPSWEEDGDQDQPRAVCPPSKVMVTGRAEVRPGSQPPG